MYTTVLIVILVTGSLLYFRHRWRQYGERYRLCIAPENHLQALEDILLGEHDYSDQFIEQVGRELDEIEQHLDAHEDEMWAKYKCVISRRRIESARQDLADANARRRR